MSLVDALKAEFLHESATTRALLAVVPSDKGDWTPHPKSMTLGMLTMHLADLPVFAPNILLASEFDMAPDGSTAYEVPPFTTAADAVQRFERGAEATMAALEQVTDASLGNTWRFLNGGRMIVAMPCGMALRQWVMNHLVHHRAQLGVYLRLLEVPLPSSYGPTADVTVGF